MLDPKTLHLIHGGHQGAEAEFGRTAERWGVDETTISFEGHKMEFSRNVEILDDAELRKGRISLDFVFERMGRRFVHGKGLRRVMKSLYHVVVRSKTLFAIGWIQEDGTVRGGTGWGVELGKLFNRTVHVFDQSEGRWFTWHDNAWTPSEPVLENGTFGATGTRNLSDHGRDAIHELFERSLGTAVAGESTETAG